MAWETSDRKSRLPPDWSKRRKFVHRRDKSMCQVRLSDGRICGKPAIDVDHIRNDDNHEYHNLRCICDWHHKKKSSAEGGRAFQAKIARNKKRFRRTEAHPGLIP